jgi:TonB family protein
MPSRRFSAPPWLSRAAALPLGLSLLLHVLFTVLLFFVPVGTEPARPDFVPVEFADLPRTTDFSPPEAGIVQGGVAKAPPQERPPSPGPPAPKAGRPKGGEPPPPREGVEKGSAAEMAAKDAKEAAEAEAEARNASAREAAAREAAAREARAREAAAREAAAKDARAREAAAKDAAARDEAERRRKAAEAAARARAGRKLLPGLGSPVLAQGAPGGRGDRPSTGNAVGTDAKAREKGEITEEGGGGFQLTTLNAPEVQYAGYFDSIRRKIELIWQYPYDAAVAGIGGELLLDFVVGRNGRVEKVELLRSSGYKVLDDEALNAVRKASPFGPIPKDYDVPELLIRGRFIYSHGGFKEIR